MKKGLALIAIITILLLIAGCNFQKKTIPDDLKNIDFNQQLTIISEDKDKYIGEINFKNTTNYDFNHILVSVQPEIRYVKNEVDTIESNPIFLRAEQIDINSKEYKYKVEIPKKIFDVYERMDKENVNVTIEGIFTKNNQMVLEASTGKDLKLIKAKTK